MHCSRMSVTVMVIQKLLHHTGPDSDHDPRLSNDEPTLLRRLESVRLAEEHLDPVQHRVHEVGVARRIRPT